MKKKYINPEITIVMVKYQTALLIGSNPAVQSMVFPGDEGIQMDPDDLEDSEDDV